MAIQKNEQPVNGEANGTEVQVTKVFAKFVVNTSQNDMTPAIITKLKALLLDYFGVSSAVGNAAESTPKVLAGVQTFAGSATGSNTVLTKGSNFAPQYAALLNGLLCHTYDFDDTNAKAILHPGASIISATLAQSEVQNATGSELLLALAVGYEVAVRLGTAQGIGAYKRGFHNTGTVGIFGSIAAVCKLKTSNQQTVENAFGLAVSRAAGSMQFLDNGAWNKRLHPGFAAHDALFCVALAEADVLGASQPIEGKYGATALFSDSGSPAGMTKGLGSTWTFLETACKPFPACRMTHCALEMVGKFTKARGSNTQLPTKITVTLPKNNYPIVGVNAPNKVHPVSVVDAQFSIYYQITASWIHGNNLGWAIYDHLQDKQVVELSNRVKVDVDESYDKLESRMRVEFEDGTEMRDELEYPLAEPSRPYEWDTGVQNKFLGMATPVYGEQGAKNICQAVDNVQEVSVIELMKLLA